MFGSCSAVAGASRREFAGSQALCSRGAGSFMPIFSAHLRARPVRRLAAYWGLLVCHGPAHHRVLLFLLLPFPFDSLPAKLLWCGSATLLSVACLPEHVYAMQLGNACMRGQSAGGRAAVSQAPGSCSAFWLRPLMAPVACAGLAWRQAGWPSLACRHGAA